MIGTGGCRGRYGTHDIPKTVGLNRFLASLLETSKTGIDQRGVQVFYGNIP